MAQIPDTSVPTGSAPEQPTNRDGLWDGKVPEITLSPTDRLERGGPWETLPTDLPRMVRWAEHYLTQTHRPQSARDRVRQVWVEGKYRPAWLGEGAKANGS